MWIRGLFNRSFYIAYLFLLIIPRPVYSAQMVDTMEVVHEKPERKAVSTLLAPTLLIGSGIATMNDRGWYSSQDAYDCIQRNFPGFQTHLDDYLIFVPAASVYGLNLAGVKGKHTFLDRSLVYLFSVTLATGTSTIIKRSTGVLRPDGSDNRSFPSRHSAIAFASATFLHEEYKDQSIWYGVAGYSIATVSGMLRMLNNKHWMSDILVGAGIGILTTKAVYLLYPLVKESLNNSGGSNSQSNLTLAPYVSPGHYGLFLHYQFP